MPSIGRERIQDVLGYGLPTALSALRLICAAVFPFATVQGRLGLILVAAISDGLDGLLARRLGRATWWGGFLDAGADKVFVATVLIDLLVRGQLAWWQVLLLLMRDLAVVAMLGLGLALRRWDRLKAASAGWLGKLTTGALFVTFLALVGWPQRTELIEPMLAASMTLSVLTAIYYALRSARSLAGASASAG